VRRSIAGGLLACLAVYAPSSTAPPAQTGQIIVDVGVEKPDGTPVTSLTAADFELRLDSLSHPIASFSAENRALRLAMLVDVSASMSYAHLNEDDRYRRTLEAVIRELQTGDRAALGRVSIKPTIGPGLSGDATALFSQVSEVLTVPDIERFGPSPLWDSLSAAIGAVLVASGSRAVVVWTDGRSTGNRLGLEDVSDHAVPAGVSVHFVIEHFPMSASRGEIREDPCADVISIVTATGGSCLVNLRDKQLSVPPLRHVRRLLAALHRRYLIGFQSPADGQMHALDVRVKRSGLLVRAPTRYLAK
jgi:hypothetical protein